MEAEYDVLDATQISPLYHEMRARYLALRSPYFGIAALAECLHTNAVKKVRKINRYYPLVKA